MSKHTIRRAKHGKSNPYFMMLRASAQDKNLSYEARGMLAYILSKPDTWHVQINDLILDATGDKPTKAGKSKVYSILNELADAQYIIKPRRYRDDKGKWIWTPYEVFEEPFAESLDQNDAMVDPYPDLPDMDGPDTGNRDILDSTESESTDEIKNSSTPDGAPATEPKAKPKREPGEFELLTAALFDMTPGTGQIRYCMAMLNGTAKRGAWKECRCDPAVSLEELREYAQWRKTKGGFKPKTADRIQASIYQFRAERDKTAKPSIVYVYEDPEDANRPDYDLSYYDYARGERVAS